MCWLGRPRCGGGWCPRGRTSHSSERRPTSPQSPAVPTSLPVRARATGPSPSPRGLGVQTVPAEQPPERKAVRRTLFHRGLGPRVGLLEQAPFAQRVRVFIARGHRSKCYKHGGTQTTETYPLMVPGRVLESRSGRDKRALKPAGEHPSPPLPAPGVAGHPWFSACRCITPSSRDPPCVSSPYKDAIHWS